MSLSWVANVPPGPAICCSIWAKVIALRRAIARLAGIYGLDAVHMGSDGFIHAGVVAGNVFPIAHTWLPHVAAAPVIYCAIALTDVRASGTRTATRQVIIRLADA
jgi:hypothetical protein